MTAEPLWRGPWDVLCSIDGDNPVGHTDSREVEVWPLLERLYSTVTETAVALAELVRASEEPTDGAPNPAANRGRPPMKPGIQGTGRNPEFRPKQRAMAEQAAKMTDEEREQIQQAFALVSEGICPTCRGALDRLRSSRQSGPSTDEPLGRSATSACSARVVRTSCSPSSTNPWGSHEVQRTWFGAPVGRGFPRT